MKLSPVEILKHLGFDVPQDGVEISGNDAYLVTSALRLAGQTIDIDRIPDAELAGMHARLAGIVNTWSAAGMINPLAKPVSDQLSAEGSLRLRSTLHVLLSQNFGRN